MTRASIALSQGAIEKIKFFKFVITILYSSFLKLSFHQIKSEEFIIKFENATLNLVSSLNGGLEGEIYSL